MSAPDEVSERASRDARVAAALDADPALGEELRVIVAALPGDRRAAFWDAFAEGLARHERPAAAVLVALGRAAAG